MNYVFFFDTTKIRKYIYTPKYYSTIFTINALLYALLTIVYNCINNCKLLYL